MSSETRQSIYNRGSYNDFIVRIKNDGEIRVSGKIEHVQSGQSQYFGDYLEMLILIQNKLDEKGYPQCDTEMRTFSETDRQRGSN